MVYKMHLDAITQWLNIETNYIYCHLQSGKGWKLYAKEGLPIEKVLRWVTSTQQLSLLSPTVCKNTGVEANGDVTQFPKLTWEVRDHGAPWLWLTFDTSSMGSNIANNFLPLTYITSNFLEHRHNSFWENCLGESDIWKSRSWMWKEK